MPRARMVVVALSLALPTVASTAAPAAVPTPAQTPNMTPVARIPYRGGTDLEITTIGGRTYVVAGAQNNYNPTEDPGIRIVDVTNPAKPVVVAFLPCNTSQNDIQVKGRYVYLAVDFNARAQNLEREDCFSQLGPEGAPSAGVLVIDIANPRKPRSVGFTTVKGAAHNTTVHPTKPYVYVSDSELATGTRLHVLDVRNPRKPTQVAEVALQQGDGVHDISFNRSGTRAYLAAGFTHTLVVDTLDPVKPALVARITDPAINFHHQAEPTPDGKYLLITDELIGAEGNQYCPGGGIHVWDISLNGAPRKVGAFYIEPGIGTEQGPRPIDEAIPFRPRRCTAHVLQLSKDGRTATMGWYSQGIQVLDLTGLDFGAFSVGGVPHGIRTLGSWREPDSDTWSAKMDSRGYVYTGDTVRGMDVVKFERPAAGSVPAGTWLTPEQALARGLRDKATAGPTTWLCFDRTYRLGLAR